MVGARLFVAIVVPGLAALSRAGSESANTARTATKQYTLEESKSIAEAFLVEKAVTTYIGTRESLKLVSVAALADRSRKLAFTFEYDSRENESEAIPHRAVIVTEQGKVISAALDGKWDMLRQKKL
ncbi:MAG: hypothetical protein PHR56_02195 [Dehalococcoidales bacterium]|nr:hypothetical protein [Dehalococcoidales bacterium]